MSIRKTLTAATMVMAGVLAAGAAQARDVYWSVGINAPVAGVGVGTVISNAPHYGYHAAPPAYVQVPAYPVYQPAPVVYAPVPVVRYRPVPPPHYVVVPQGYGHPYHHGHRHGKKHGHRHGHR
ncbi:MAG: hypothetical protein ACK4PH_13290 [Aquincola tertiaricarbonis]|uniref:hypothetical protein n=1 Tax=Aquincola tertiaricarbonis TaxID=391953 RepID=UPI000614AA7D|nr:hypothetical protein [Aquincola tertiaricarbonis]